MRRAVPRDEQLLSRRGLGQLIDENKPALSRERNRADLTSLALDREIAAPYRFRCGRAVDPEGFVDAEPKLVCKYEQTRVVLLALLACEGDKGVQLVGRPAAVRLAKAPLLQIDGEGVVGRDRVPVRGHLVVIVTDGAQFALDRRGRDPARLPPLDIGGEVNAAHVRQLFEPESHSQKLQEDQHRAVVPRSGRVCALARVAMEFVQLNFQVYVEVHQSRVLPQVLIQFFHKI